jgi:hypothetical protein
MLLGNFVSCGVINGADPYSAAEEERTRKRRSASRLSMFGARGALRRHAPDAFAGRPVGPPTKSSGLHAPVPGWQLAQ